MSPITHLLASWAVAETSELDDRDRNLITWAGVLPDLDGIGAVVDYGNRLLGRPETNWYTEWHHVLLHGLFGAVLIPAVLAAWATRRARVFLFGFAVVHLHLLCDIVGSRGPEATDIWPIHYLGPFSRELTVQWSGQWQLNAWPNVAVSAALIAFVFVRANTVGHSPLLLLSKSGNGAFVETVRARWQQIRRPA